MVRRREAPGRVRAAVYAVAVHLAVLAFLVVSFRFSRLDTSYVLKTGPRVIHAFMVGSAPPMRRPPAPALPKSTPSPPVPKPRARAHQKALQQARAKAQAVAQAKARALLKTQEQAKAREARARALAAAKARAQALAAAKVKALAAAKARAKALAAAKAQAQARLKVEEKQAAARARARLRQQIAQALARARAKAAAQKAAAEAARGVVDRYKALIEARVSAAWVAVPGSKGLRCRVLVRLIAGGQVVSARIVQSSGNAVFDRSVIAAIYNAAPLPVPRSAAKLQ